MTWSPSEGSRVRTPGLLWPDTTFASPPAWVDGVLTGKPGTHPGKVELVSGGTWFYPTGATGPLVVPPTQPAPSTKVQVVPVGDELAIFHDAAGWASNPKVLIPAFIEARREATPGRLLWAPGLGTPEDYALWCYLGVDLFDASPLLLAALRGQALTTDGTMDAVSASRAVGDGKPWGEAELLAHNVEAARREIEKIRMAIETGTLRALVERRSASKPASVELLRRFDREHGYLEAAAPHHRTATLPAMTVDALWMPEVESFRRRLRGSYQPPSAPILVLLPCSQKKPYKISRSHRAFQRVLDESGIRHLVHEVMITSPLGLVPRELEEVYPAQAYDIPVTGHWLRDEEAIVREQLAAILVKGQYKHVIVHSGQATFDVLRDLLPEETRHTCLHHPTRGDDLARLAAELARVKALLTEGVPRHERKLADLRALLSFQFNEAVAAELTDGAVAHGRMPFVKLDRANVQVGMTTLDRGVVSLTLDGAQALAKHKTRRVFIGDFTPKKTSTLFAVGVTSADPDVRAGDEVAIVRASDPAKVLGCGVAQMDAASMTHLKRGVAATLRHLVGEAKPAAPVPTVSEKEVVA